MFRLARIVGVCTAIVTAIPVISHAAPKPWVEIHSAHFTVWAPTDDSDSRGLAWQLEQVRYAVSVSWPWAKVDVTKPTVVFGVKGENGMRELAPEYWERKDAVHPASVWVEGADRNYLIVRTDIAGQDAADLNPYTSTYFSYVYLILESSLDRPLPLWFARGLSGVMSNTVVRSNEIRIGSPIPWHLQRLHESGRLPLKDLVRVDRKSRDYTDDARLEVFDAESWAFVHYLMFGDNAAHRAALNAYVSKLASGEAADKALAETIGAPEALENAFAGYLSRDLFSYQRMKTEVSVDRKQFAVHPLTAGQLDAGEAELHVAMGRPVEARQLIAQARAVEPDNAEAFVAEGLQADRDGKPEAAREAFGRAADLGSMNAYAYYRAADLCWPRPDHGTLLQMEKRLVRATELNPSLASAYDDLAEVRALLGDTQGAIVPLLVKAIALEPSEAEHHLTAARVLTDLHVYGEARKSADMALSLATTDAERAAARQILGTIAAREAEASQGMSAPAPATSAQSPAVAGAADTTAHAGAGRPDTTAMTSACQRGDTTACAALYPLAERACAAGQQAACLTQAALQVRGLGVAKDEDHGIATMQQLCDGGMLQSCAQLGVTVAQPGPHQDVARARTLLTKSCDGGLARACDLLKMLPGK